MKFYSLLAFFGLFTVSSLFSQDKSMLFIGDDYTSTNNLPLTLNLIAGSKGSVLTYESNTPVDFTLQDHGVSAQTTSLIEEGVWDHVVIQEQSQIPSLDEATVNSQFYPYASDLVNYSRQQNECCTPILFMTWGRENGDQQNCLDWPPVCTFDGMQDLLTQRYVGSAVQNDCWTAPVGEAWRLAREQSNDLIDLYATDGSHPSEAGTYLTACVFYAVVWDDSPTGADYYGNLSQEDAQFLQGIAQQVVFGSPEEWNLTPLLWADLSVEEGLLPFYNITLNTSYWVDSVHVQFDIIEATWEDGDVSSIILEEGQTYDYVLTVFAPCGSETFTDSYTVEIPDNIEMRNDFKVMLFPNPASEFIRIESNQPCDYKIWSVGGQVVMEGSIFDNSELIDIRKIQDGIYSVQLQNMKGKQTLQFLKIN